MTENNDFAYADTLAAMLIFSDDFARFCSQIGQSVCYYKICAMLNVYKRKLKNKKEINRVDEHIAFYRHQLVMAINLAEESLSELAEDNAAFISNIMRDSSDALGMICDELLTNYGYGDVPDLMDSAEGVDLSDFIVDFYHSNDEDDENDDYDEDVDATDN